MHRLCSRLLRSNTIFSYFSVGAIVAKSVHKGPLFGSCRITPMLSFMQLKLSKAKRKFTQQQRAQIVDIEVARKFVRQAIQETLAVNRHIPEGLSEEDLDRIFNNQPVHFDGMGYVPRWFERQDIKWWGKQICVERYRSEYEQKK
jgi:hypothetical protein